MRGQSQHLWFPLSSNPKRTHILKIGEVVRLDRRILNLIEARDLLKLGTVASDGKLKLGHGNSPVEGSRAICRGLHLDADVEHLAGDELGLVGREDAAEIGAENKDQQQNANSERTEREPEQRRTKLPCGGTSAP